MYIRKCTWRARDVRATRAMNSFFFLHARKRKRSRAQKEHIFSLSNCVFVRAPYVDVNGDAVALVSPAQIVIKSP